MLLGQLGGLFKECYVSDRYVTILYDVLRRYKEDLDLPGAIREFAETYERLRKAEQLTRQEDRIRRIYERDGREGTDDRESGKCT